MMPLSLIQWAFVLVFGFWIGRLVWLMGTRAIPRRRGLIWLVLWSFGLAVVAKPELSHKLANILGVTRGTDAIVYSAIALLSLLVFRAFNLIDLQDRQISQLTTALALKNWEKDQLENEPPKDKE
jgi:small membrane protein